MTLLAVFIHGVYLNSRPSRTLLNTLPVYFGEFSFSKPWNTAGAAKNFSTFSL